MSKETKKERRQREIQEAKVSLAYMLAHKEEIISDKSQAYYDWDVEYNTEKLRGMGIFAHRPR